MSHPNTLISLLVLLPSSLVLQTTVFAQTGDSEPSKTSEVITFKPTVVTANKIEENLKDIPVSISVIDSVDIEDKNINDVADVVKQTPNLSETSYGYQRAINFRGINQSLFTSTNPVVIYADGVPQNSIFDYEVMLENVERVEILRGPQGTLYGKDSIGGVINVITKEPENEWQGNVGFEYGTNNLMKGSLNANGALIEDKLLLSFGILGQKDDGWITNDYDGTDANKFKELKTNATLTAKPTDNITTKLSLGVSQSKTKFINGGIGKLHEITRKQAEHANYEIQSFTDNKSNYQALNIDYKIDNLKLSSLTTHKDISVDGKYDGDYSYDAKNTSYMNGLYMFQDIDLDNFSQEFKLSSDNDEHLKWVAGIYFDKENNRYNAMGYQFPYVNAKGKFLGGFEVDIPSKTNAKTLATFAQGIYGITDALSLTLGGRYQEIEKDIKLTSYMYPTSKGKVGSVATTPRSQDASWRAFLPKAALSFALNEDINTYVSYSKGYLPGGFNYFPTSAKDKLKFDAQTSDNYEIGLRGSVLAGKLDFGATIFYMDIDDIHLFDAGYGKNNVFYSVVSNGGKAISKGVEMDGVYRINNNWTANAALGLVDAKYTKHINDTFNNNNIRHTPKYTANFGVGYFHPQGFYGRLDANAQGEIYFDDGNMQKQKAWITADTRVGYMKGDLNVYGYVKNITDESHVENFRQTQVYFNDPRAFGLGIKYSY